MSFTVIPETDQIGEIKTRTLKDAIVMKHFLLAKMNLRAIIRDGSSCLVSEREQSNYIYGLFS